MFLERFWGKMGTRPGWLAVVPYPDRIDVAHVHRHFGEKPHVVLCDSYRNEGDGAGALKHLCRELEMTRYRCSTLLQAGNFNLLAVEPPPVPDAELKSALRWRVQDMLDYPVDDATLDVLPIMREDDTQRVRSVFAVTARNAVVKATMQMFADAMVPLESIDIPELAQRNIAALFESGDHGLALLTFDHVGGLVTLNYRTELFATRRIDIPLAALLESRGDDQQQYFDRIVLEVQRSLDYADRHFSYIAMGELLVPPLPPSVPLLDYLAANLAIAVKPLNLGAVFDLVAVPLLQQPASQNQWLHVLGAALRDEGTGE